MFSVELATVQAGATPFREGNVNDTFKGLIRTRSGLVSSVIKDLDPKQLSNELLVATLAKDHGLPVPDCYLAAVPAGTLSATKGPKLSSGEQLVFASADVGVPNLAQRIKSDPQAKSVIYDELKKWSSLGKLYALDSWIANVDRHRGNLLFGGAGSIWLIDHGHALTGPGWTAAALKADASVRNRLKEWMTPELTEREKRARSTEATSAAATFTSIGTSNALARSRASEILPAGDASAAEQFLITRVAHVSKLASDALDCASLI
jgi:hypothetical protein